MTKSIPTNIDCWLWAGSISQKGYGTLRVDGKNKLAHRVLYEAWVAPIPEGLEPDHLCEVKACINPDHIEPVTHQENIRRGMAKKTQTHCKNGHLFKPETTWVTINKYGTKQRTCWICNKARMRNYSKRRYWELNNRRKK